MLCIFVMIMKINVVIHNALFSSMCVNLISTMSGVHIFGPNNPSVSSEVDWTFNSLSVFVILTLAT